MPLYEYRCESCGRAEERLESLSAPARHDCPACGAALGMARQLSVPALASAEAGGSLPEMPPCAAGGGCAGGCPFSQG
jgi:putative FmdB family regulatory protein